MTEHHVSRLIGGALTDHDADRSSSSPGTWRPRPSAGRGGYPRVVATGPPRELGLQYGRAARERIRRSIAAYTDVFDYYAHMSWAEARRKAQAFVPAIRAYDEALPDAARRHGGGSRSRVRGPARPEPAQRGHVRRHPARRRRRAPAERRGDGGRDAETGRVHLRRRPPRGDRRRPHPARPELGLAHPHARHDDRARGPPGRRTRLRDRRRGGPPRQDRHERERRRRRDQHHRQRPATPASPACRTTSILRSLLASENVVRRARRGCTGRRGVRRRTTSSPPATASRSTPSACPAVR